LLYVCAKRFIKYEYLRYVVFLQGVKNGKKHQFIQV
jgi:hypothetical protein